MAQTESMGTDPLLSDLDVILTDDDGVIPFHQAVFGETTVTDVITQRYHPMPGASPDAAGELIVNLDRAEAHHATEGRSRELARYLAHGCLHLAGMEDANPAQRAAMRRHEDHLLADAESLGYINDLLQAPS